MILRPALHSPETWVLVFNREASSLWMSRLAFGRYKHVRAYAWLPGVKAWLFYDVHFDGTSIEVVPDGDEAAKTALWQFTHRADLMRVRVSANRSRKFPILYRLGFWCVPAIKHLIGLRSGALRPDRLWADCLAAGGEPLFEARNEGADIPTATKPTGQQ